MSQSRLFDEPDHPARGAYGHYGGTPPHSNDTTSRAAAESVAPFAGTQRGLVLDLIRSRGAAGCTGDEIELNMNISHQACGPRLRELVKSRLIKDSGGTRPTRTGRKAIVWVAIGGGS